jgi:AAA15 family ATPase/GTPase
LKFTPGFNVIVGENNVGKTALLEALSLSFSNHVHRSLVTRPQVASPYDQTSKCKISFELVSGEAAQLLRQICSSQTIPISIVNQDDQNQALSRFTSAIARPTKLISEFSSNQFTAAHLESYGIPSSTLENYEIPNCTNALEIGLDKATGNFKVFSFPKPTPLPNHYGPRLAYLLRDKIYAFKAERFKIDACVSGANPNLATDASNLPEVLNLLQNSNPTRYGRFIDLVKIVFPQIKYITVPSIGGNQVKILVWTHSVDSERADLAVPLLESGTGLGQVLAILYVVVNADEPKTIIIDEPQSFLHPGAVRKLFEILKFPEYLKHQFIITTHSPAAVTATNPKTLLLIRKKEFESYVDEIDVSDNQQMELFLSAVGARLSDVFGADNILWVEGPTEERCFPLLLERVVKQPLLGTKVVGVLHTGDFEGKHSKTVLEIYTKLTQGQGLLPPAIGFIFDRENRSAKDREDLERQSGGKFSWLPRKMYENYLLNPNAISDVLSTSDPSGETVLVPQDVQQWLQENGNHSRYIENTSATTGESQWLIDVDGAKILADLFIGLSDTRVSFDKVRHGVALTEWLIEHDPSSFAEIVTLIKTALGLELP